MIAKPGDFDFYCEEDLSGKTKVEVLYESEGVLAFFHTKPSYQTHIVVIPKKHIHDLVALEEEDLTILNEIFKVCKDLVKRYDYENLGGKVITNLGKFQDTPHLHFHLIVGDRIV